MRVLRYGFMLLVVMQQWVHAQAPSPEFLQAWSAGGAGLDQGKSVAVDDNGNILVIGDFTGSAVFGDSALSGKAGQNIFFTKYDASGRALWARVAGGDLQDLSAGIATDNNGNVMIAGTFRRVPPLTQNATTSAEDLDILLAQYDAAGQRLWSKPLGGSYDDVAHAVAADHLGNIYLTGAFSESASFDSLTLPTGALSSAGGKDLFLAKYNSSGKLLWARSAGGVGDDAGLSIVADNDGEVYIAGYFNARASFEGRFVATRSASDTVDLFIAKYDFSGALQWVKSAGGEGFDAGTALAVDGDNNLYMTGVCTANAVFETSPVISYGAQDVFIAAYTSAGDLRWARTAGGLGTDAGLDLVAEKAGTVLVTGGFRETAAFDEGFSLTSAGEADVFLARYDAFGKNLGAWRYGATAEDRGQSLALRANNQIVLTGSFTQALELGQHHLFSSEQSQDVFVANLCFGCVARSPRVEAVGASLDGHAAADTIGSFLPIVALNNTFSANVSDADGASDVVEVRFVLRDAANQFIAQASDHNASDGWSWDFNTKNLDGWASPAKLEVEAVDRTGLKHASSTVIKFLDKIPRWLRKLHEKGILQSSFVRSDTAYVLKVTLAETDLWRRDFTARLLGEFKNHLTIGGDAEIIYSLNQSRIYGEYEAHGVAVILNETVLKKEISGPIKIPVSNLITFVIKPLDTTFTLFNKERGQIPLVNFGFARLYLSVKYGATLAVHHVGLVNLLIDSSSYFEPGIRLGMSVNGVVDLGIASVTASAAINSEAYLRLFYGHDSSGTFHVVKIDGNRASAVAMLNLKLRACIGRRWWRVCAEKSLKEELFKINLLGGSGAMPEVTSVSGGSLEMPSTQALNTPVFNVPTVPEVLEAPRFAANTNAPLLVWMHNADTSSMRPQIHFAAWANHDLAFHGALDTSTALRMDPHVGALDSNTVVVVWTQNLLDHKATPSSEKEIVSQQEIFAKIYDRKTASWGAAINLSQNNLPDGKAQFASDGKGAGLATWTQQSTLASAREDSLFLPSAWELYFSFYQKEAGAWSRAQALTHNAAADFGVRLMHANGFFAAVWAHDADGDFKTEYDEEIRLAIFDPLNAAWSAPVTLSRSSSFKREPQIVVTKKGRPVVMWQEQKQAADSSVASQLWYVIASPSYSNWTEPRLLHESAQRLETPVMVALPLGEGEPVAVSWREMSRETGEVLVSLANLGEHAPAWSVPDTLASDSRVHWMNTMAVDDKNNLAVVYAKTVMQPDTMTSIPRDLGNFGTGHNLDLVVRGVAMNLALRSRPNTALGRLGDVNADGRINALDALYIASYLEKVRVPETIAQRLAAGLADADFDGAMTKADLSLLKDYLAGAPGNYAFGQTVAY